MRRLVVLLAFTLASAEIAIAAEPDAVTRAHHFHLDGGVALGGYDPVRYFRDGPRKGDASHELTHQGVTYRFTSEETRRAFLADPARYEPAYGGWCAWAMIDGEKVAPNPKTYAIIEGRLMLFYDGLLGDTLARWNARAATEGEARLVALADAQWEKLAH